jgi:hypothetical protein
VERLEVFLAAESSMYLIQLLAGRRLRRRSAPAASSDMSVSFGVALHFVSAGDCVCGSLVEIGSSVVKKSFRVAKRAK